MYGYSTIMSYKDVAHKAFYIENSTFQIIFKGLEDESENTQTQ